MFLFVASWYILLCLTFVFIVNGSFFLIKVTNFVLITGHFGLSHIMATGQIFSRNTQALFYNYKQLPIQRMLDFDFLCGLLMFFFFFFLFPCVPTLIFEGYTFFIYLWIFLFNYYRKRNTLRCRNNQSRFRGVSKALFRPGRNCNSCPFNVRHPLHLHWY